MAITNTQQFKQLVNPPMEGKKRPGYRGEDAARSDAASGRDAGRADPSGGVDRGGGRNPMAQFGTTPEERAIVEAIGEREMAKRNQKIGLGNKLGIPNFFPTIKTGLNLFKVPTGNKFAVDFNRSLRDLNEEEDDTGNGGGENYIPPLIAQAPSIVEQEPEIEIEEEEPFEFYRRFRADGGIMNTDVVGGEMDFDSARQMYGLGKLVKKITRSVKKVAKSPIGKAALLYAGTAGLGSLATGGGMGSLFKLGTYAPGSVASNFPSIFTRAGAKNILFGGEKLLGNPTKGNLVPFSGILGSGGKFDALKAITTTSIASGLLTSEQEEEAQQISDETGINIEEIRANPNKYLARRFRAEGGSTEGKEPVAKKVMPLLDMDGQEKDYRETGGFVDMGRMEKADDVPARLSKNEFVFTADAVRNAGDGSVDKGAEVMYNMMKNLESGGDVSEESQGLEGARKMFQTSQRLEEVL